MKTHNYKIIQQLALAAALPFAAAAAGFQFDTTIGTNYPAAGSAIIALAKTSTALYVANVNQVYKYTIANRTWQALLADASPPNIVCAICTSPVDSYIYIAGDIVWDAENRYTLIRYNPANNTLSHIGANPCIDTSVLNK